MVDGAHPSQPELYDLQHADAERGDVPFYVERAREADGPTLELACGTGRVHLELLRAGVDVDGVDVDPDSLDRLRAKARAAGLSPSVRESDMRDPTVDRTYGLVVCPFNAIQHATTLADLRATLAGAHGALSPGGRFVFDVFVPRFDVIRETYGEWREESVEYDGREYRVRSRTRVTDHAEQLFTVETELRTAAGETVRREAHEIAMLPRRLVRLLADGSPFASASVAGGFDGRPLGADDRTQVWTLEKAE
ncbi:class I SAM-dependent methyltransferase [Candidatus Halobonum tyrrellensis]|uniref:Type 12 methyltransferase n=1 Tax=Candidatus Halobonum tyrrellensis G22 TaxID=1324957 RepID=V4HD75_9EURY|nr:class I SAM-dependent methyltransferase [Candidatus Halobonum tyrrellensis]ESP88018.1 type 12 methyltransferase [Candidatus Halobonum tyrrellensis G22]